MTDNEIEQHTRLADAISDLLAGIQPVVQASVISDILGTFLAGFDEHCRPRITHHVLKQALRFANYHDEHPDDD